MRSHKKGSLILPTQYLTISPDNVGLHATVEGDNLDIFPRVKNTDLLYANFVDQVTLVGVVELHVLVTQQRRASSVRQAF